jgi:transcription factor SFP1
MRDFSCCGMTLASLHDLLQHYEEAHAQKAPQPVKSTSIDPPPIPMPASGANISTNASAVQTHSQHADTDLPIGQQDSQQHHPRHQLGGSKTVPSSQASALLNNPLHNMPKSSTLSNTLQTCPDMDTVEDMEMDEDLDALDDRTTPPASVHAQALSNQPSPQLQFHPNHHQSRLPQLNLTMLQGHQGLRNSSPSTPVAQGRQGLSFHNNPTVSSVNTPTLMSKPMQQQFPDLSGHFRGTPDSSAPGTPAELDEGIMSGMGDMSVQNNALMSANQHATFPYGGFGTNNDMLDLCIDEPAKRLFSPAGGYGNQNQQYAHMRLGNGQYGPDSDVARRIREQQMLAGVPDTTAGMMPNDEPKPFRCPVIGCEKAYKNQNGLKYHKSVSRCNIPDACPLGSEV